MMPVLFYDVYKSFDMSKLFYPLRMLIGWWVLIVVDERGDVEDEEILYTFRGTKFVL